MLSYVNRQTSNVKHRTDFDRLMHTSRKDKSFTHVRSVVLGVLDSSVLLDNFEVKKEI